MAFQEKTGDGPQFLRVGAALQAPPPVALPLLLDPLMFCAPGSHKLATPETRLLISLLGAT